LLFSLRVRGELLRLERLGAMLVRPFLLREIVEELADVRPALTTSP
jgi:hypothetical protein